MSMDLLTITEFLCVTFFGVGPWLVAYSPSFRRPDGEGARPPLVYTPYALIYPTGLIMMVAFIGLARAGSLHSIGLRLQHVNQILAGPFILALIIAAEEALYWATPLQRPSRRPQDPYIRVYANARTDREQAFVILYLIFASVAEELVFRGYFVLLWGDRTGMPWMCGTVTAIVCAALHAYQGKQYLVHHLLMAFTFTLVALLTGSIILAISIHVWHNIFYCITVWRSKRREAPSPPPLPDSEIRPLWTRRCRIYGIASGLTLGLLVAILRTEMRFPGDDTIPAILVLVLAGLGSVWVIAYSKVSGWEKQHGGNARQPYKMPSPRS